jgi:hypothetical protein
LSNFYSFVDRSCSILFYAPLKIYFVGACSIQFVTIFISPDHKVLKNDFFMAFGPLIVAIYNFLCGRFLPNFTEMVLVSALVVTKFTHSPTLKQHD